MVTTMGELEAIAVTAIMVRQKITDQAITTDVAIETIIIKTIIMAIENIMELTDVSIVTYLIIVTDHIDTEAMVVGNKEVYSVII